MPDLGLGDLPLWNWALQGSGLCTAYIGAELNARRRRSGFAIWIVSNAILAALHVATGMWLLLLLDLLFLRVNVMGLRCWNDQHPLEGPTS